VHFPHEERPAGRKKRITPIYDDLKKSGAVFGAAYGWERPNYFGAESELTFRRPDWFDAVKAECQAVAENVGIADLSPFSKFRVTGKDATEFINRLGANTAPRIDGKISLTHALNDAGGVAAEFTVTRMDASHYYLTSAAFSERHDFDLLHARKLGDVQVENLTESIGILGLMGPSSKDILLALTDDELAFPWLSAKHITIADVKVHALRVSYVGEQGVRSFILGHMP